MSPRTLFFLLLVAFSSKGSWANKPNSTNEKDTCETQLAPQAGLSFVQLLYSLLEKASLSDDDFKKILVKIQKSLTPINPVNKPTDSIQLLHSQGFQKILAEISSKDWHYIQSEAQKIKSEIKQKQKIKKEKAKATNQIFRIGTPIQSSTFGSIETDVIPLTNEKDLYLIAKNENDRVQLIEVDLNKKKMTPRDYFEPQSLRMQSDLFDRQSSPVVFENSGQKNVLSISEGGEIQWAAIDFKTKKLTSLHSLKINEKVSTTPHLWTTSENKQMIAFGTSSGHFYIFQIEKENNQLIQKAKIELAGDISSKAFSVQLNTDETALFVGTSSQKLYYLKWKIQSQSLELISRYDFGAPNVQVSEAHFIENRIVLGVYGRMGTAYTFDIDPQASADPQNSKEKNIRIRDYVTPGMNSYSRPVLYASSKSRLYFAIGSYDGRVEFSEVDLKTSLFKKLTKIKQKGNSGTPVFFEDRNQNLFIGIPLFVEGGIGFHFIESESNEVHFKGEFKTSGSIRGQPQMVELPSSQELAFVFGTRDGQLFVLPILQELAESTN